LLLASLYPNGPVDLRVDVVGGMMLCWAIAVPNIWHVVTSPYQTFWGAYQIIWYGVPNGSM
jgi:hypothetical protein